MKLSRCEIFDIVFFSLKVYKDLAKKGVQVKAIMIGRAASPSMSLKMSLLFSIHGISFSRSARSNFSTLHFSWPPIHVFTAFSCAWFNYRNLRFLIESAKHYIKLQVTFWIVLPQLVVQFWGCRFWLLLGFLFSVQDSICYAVKNGLVFIDRLWKEEMD